MRDLGSIELRADTATADSATRYFVVLGMVDAAQRLGHKVEVRVTRDHRGLPAAVVFSATPTGPEEGADGR